TDLLADQILRRLNPGVSIDPHLRQAEQPAGKHRYGSKRHASTLGNQIIRQRQFADIELALLQHALVAILAVLQWTRLADFEHLKIDPFDPNRAVKEGNVTIIMR